MLGLSAIQQGVLSLCSPVDRAHFVFGFFTKKNTVSLEFLNLNKNGGVCSGEFKKRQQNLYRFMFIGRCVF